VGEVIVVFVQTKQIADHAAGRRRRRRHILRWRRRRRWWRRRRRRWWRRRARCGGGLAVGRAALDSIVAIVVARTLLEQ